MANLRKALIRLAHKNPQAREVILPILKEAKKWQDTALKELAEEMGLDADRFRVRRQGRGIEVSGAGRGWTGESEWLVFEDWDDAEEAALERVKEDLEYEPSIFNQDWLRKFVTVSDADASMIGQEEAEHYVGDLNVDRDKEQILEMARMNNEWDELEDERWELEDQLDETFDRDAEKKIQDQIDKIVEKQESLVEDAKEKLIEIRAAEIEAEVKEDPLAWWEERVGRLDMDKLPNWMRIDIDEAAESAIRHDGVAHFLDRYDGDAVELESGAVAFGTN